MTAPPLTTSTWRLTVAYHGAHFAGWQRQEGQRTVQQVLEDALSRVCGGAPARARAAGRTDAGVHARAQTVSTTLTSRVLPTRMVLALASHLPDDVSVVRAEIMPPGFDAKRHSVGKRYCYRLHHHPAWDPFVGPFRWHLRGGLDVEAMRRAAACLVGEHDFEAFRSVHCDAAHARRYIWSLDVTRASPSDPLVEIEVRGNAFCKNMVRIISGTLVDVGRGRLQVADVARILASRDRTQGGVTAPASGLTLEEVYYPDTIAHAGIPPDARFPGHPVDDEDWPPRLPAASIDRTHDDEDTAD